jgi:hypothetical protein
MADDRGKTPAFPAIPLALVLPLAVIRKAMLLAGKSFRRN